MKAEFKIEIGFVMDENFNVERLSINGPATLGSVKKIIELAEYLLKEMKSGKHTVHERYEKEDIKIN